MDWANILSFSFIALLLVVSPGPNGVLIAKTVPTSGRSAGFSNISGFIFAFFLHGALSVFGLSVILLQSANLFFLVKIIGAGYLCWIGLKALYEASKNGARKETIIPSSQKRTMGSAFWEGALTNVFNPKVSMFYLAAFPQFIPAGEGAVLSALVLVLIHALMNAIWFGVMVLLFSRLTMMAKQGSFQRWLKAVSGVVFIGFGVRLAMFKP